MIKNKISKSSSASDALGGLKIIKEIMITKVLLEIKDKE